jgi:hypothetical protein
MHTLPNLSNVGPNMHLYLCLPKSSQHRLKPYLLCSKCPHKNVINSDRVGLGSLAPKVSKQKIGFQCLVELPMETKASKSTVPVCGFLSSLG